MTAIKLTTIVEGPIIRGHCPLLRVTAFFISQVTYIMYVYVGKGLPTYYVTRVNNTTNLNRDWIR